MKRKQNAKLILVDGCPSWEEDLISHLEAGHKVEILDATRDQCETAKRLTESAGGRVLLAGNYIMCYSPKLFARNGKGPNRRAKG